MNYLTINNKQINYEVDSNGCWNCLNMSCDSNGYPRIGINYKQIKIHRLIYMNFVIKIDELDSKIVVRHKCDNKKCINPEHLIHGSQGDNIKDKIIRNRTGFKLSKSDVIEIKYLYYTCNIRQHELAVSFGVDQNIISRIVNNKIWKHVN